MAGAEITTFGGGVVSTTGVVPDPLRELGLVGPGKVELAPTPLDPALDTVPARALVATDEAFNPPGTV